MFVNIQHTNVEMSSRGGTEACLAVEREQEKVVKKMRTFSDSSADKLQKIIDQVTELKLQLSSREYSIWSTPHNNGVATSNIAHMAYTVAYLMY